MYAKVNVRRILAYIKGQFEDKKIAPKLADASGAYKRKSW
jgi:hypothetical protein